MIQQILRYHKRFFGGVLDVSIWSGADYLLWFCDIFKVGEMEVFEGGSGSQMSVFFYGLDRLNLWRRTKINTRNTKGFTRCTKE